MKCISLFVCFFISLQSMIVPSYEVLISNIESKVDTIHEDRASFLSLKCRDIAMDVTSKKRIYGLKWINKKSVWMSLNVGINIKRIIMN